MTLTDEQLSTAINAELHIKLLNAVTNFDRRQVGKRGYNTYALPQYVQAVNNVMELREQGKSIRQAILASFTGRLLDACLKAVGEPEATMFEQVGRGYR